MVAHSVGSGHIDNMRHGDLYDVFEGASPAKRGTTVLKKKKREKYHLVQQHIEGQSTNHTIQSQGIPTYSR